MSAIPTKKIGSGGLSVQFFDDEVLLYPPATGQTTPLPAQGSQRFPQTFEHQDTEETPRGAWSQVVATEPERK